VANDVVELAGPKRNRVRPAKHVLDELKFSDFYYGIKSIQQGGHIYKFNGEKYEFTLSEV
jgi:hypothetical protein